MNNLFFGGDIATYSISLPILLIAVFDIVMKAISIYMAAGRGERWWAVALLVFNTAGVLPIVYIIFFARRAQRVEIEDIKDVKDTDVNEQ